LIKNVIFDFDGTLVDSDFVVENVNSLLMKKYRIEDVDARDFRAMNTLPLKQRFKKLGIPLYKLPLMILEAIKLYSYFISEIKLIEGIHDLLKKLSENSVELYILSSNSSKNIKKFLQSNKINFFKDIYSTSNTIEKDRTMAKLIRDKRLPKENVLYVGDQLEDIFSCKKIQVRIAAVSWGCDSADLLEKGEPDFLCNKPADLYDIICQEMT
jgi:phosphoglycolate phosphatase